MLQFCSAHARGGFRLVEAPGAEKNWGPPINIKFKKKKKT